MEDWQTVASTDLKEAGFPHPVSRVKLGELLREKYPNVDRHKVNLLRGKQKRAERGVGEASVEELGLPITAGIGTPKREGTRKLPNGHWRSLENRRQFFLELAKEWNFDPFVAENWNNVSHVNVKRKKVSETS